MKDYLEIPICKLDGVTYTNPDRIPDELELSFMREIQKKTDFILMRIKLIKAKKSKYSRTIDYFEFDYFDKRYILEKETLIEVYIDKK